MRAASSRIAIAASILAWAPALAAASSTQLGLSATLGSEHDSNARREVSAGEVVQDGLVRSSLGADLRFAEGPHRLGATATVGAKVFATERAENTGAALFNASYQLRLLRDLAAGVDLHARARRLVDGDRDYQTAALNAALTYSGLGPLFLEARVGPRGFRYEPNPQFSNAGLGGGLVGRLRISGREQLVLGYDIDGRYFPDSPVLLSLEGDDLGEFAPDPERRADLRHAVTLSAATARRLFCSVSYTLVYNQSQSLGETYLRHRAQLLAGTHLPLELFASVTAGLQITQYPDGLAISQRLLLEDSDESQNKLVLTLRRPITERLAIEGRVGLFSNELSDSGLSFARATTYIGFSYRS